MPLVDVNTGARLHYEDVGQGEPLIAFHGLLGSARRHLGRVIDWLSADYRVLGLTMRGYGESTPKPRDFPPNFYHRDAADVLAFMDALGIERAHLLGFSDGGEITLICVGKHPERFHSAIAWGAVGYFGPRLLEVITRPDYPARLAPRPEDMFLHGIPNAEAFAQAWIASVRGMIDSGGDVSLSLADKIACPLLLMLGRQDTLNPEAYGRTFVERTPRGRLEMFDTGHAIHEQDWEGFRRVVGDFLNALKGPSA